ncbi:MAG: hypothetical protein JST01_18615 [Cyanobacteria bacterium SZAS TMP-1]|nr:hypothetical protein [Cyanobacteria bacterium SZAS TMP-1]
MFRFLKTAKAVANIAMLLLSWQWYRHGFGLEFSAGCLALSFMWLALTVCQMNFLMRSFVTILSRLQMILPMGFGLGLSAAALWSSQSSAVAAAALACVASWICVFGWYLRQKKQFEKRGYGVLPKGIMINPPAEMLPPGAILLMTGIPEAIGEAVGHGEIVIPDGDKKWAFSTYMAYGVVMNPLEEVLPRRAKRGITVARVPVVPWTEEQCKHSLLQARSMLRQNKEYVVRTREARAKMLESLPLPAIVTSLIGVILQKTMPVTGYDWFGLVLGRVKMNRWTCIGSVQELLWRMGITLDRYFGTGLLGAGTSILDPIMPARFFDLKCYRDLTEADYRSWLAAQANK